MAMDIEWRDIPEYAVIMDKDYFIRACQDKWFKNNDGIAKLCKNFQMSNIALLPSDAINNKYSWPEWCNKIAWFSLGTR
jgi:hypothetical protein